MEVVVVALEDAVFSTASAMDAIASCTLALVAAVVVGLDVVPYKLSAAAAEICAPSTKSTTCQIKKVRRVRIVEANPNPHP